MITRKIGGQRDTVQYQTAFLGVAATTDAFICTGGSTSGTGATRVGAINFPLTYNGFSCNIRGNGLVADSEIFMADDDVDIGDAMTITNGVNGFNHLTGQNVRVAALSQICLHCDNSGDAGSYNIAASFWDFLR